MRTILYFVIGSWLLHQYIPLQCYVKRRYGVIWYYFLPKRRRIATTPFNYPCFSLSLVTDRPSRRALNSYCVAWKTCSLTLSVVKVPYCSIIYSMTDCWFFFVARRRGYFGYWNMDWDRPRPVLRVYRQHWIFHSRQTVNGTRRICDDRWFLGLLWDNKGKSIPSSCGTCNINIKMCARSYFDRRETVPDTNCKTP